jgi:hypothetical protein
MEEQMAAYDFAIKDYELKIRYLTDHFGRMWPRFNYFVVVQTAIVGGKFLTNEGKLSSALAVTGAFLAAIWYVMGAEDRFLVQVYRKHVEDAAKRVVDLAEWEDSRKKADYRYVGEIEASAKEIRMNPTGWRVPAISTTRLAAIVPLIVFAVWIGILIRVN